MFPLWVFTALAAFGLASVAGFFSISGLAALYAAAFIPVILMASVVEFGKIVATFWLHQNFKKVSKLWIVLLTVVVIGSMAVTSGGVFGFLTKGHLDQEIPLADTSLRIERIDNRVSSQQRIIERAETRIDQLDGIIDTLVDFDKISGLTGARAVREGQADERQEIQSLIDSSFVQIGDLRDDRLELSRTVAEVEAKLGPVKFLAALFGVDTDKTVTYFTLLIVLLLDPFAILLIIATSISHQKWREARGIKKNGGVKIVEKIVEKEIEVPIEVKVEVEKIVEKIIEKQVPINKESLIEFLEDTSIQKEWLDDPKLMSIIENLAATLSSTDNKQENTIKETKPVSNKRPGWLQPDGPSFSKK